jgi:hypothetical protein
MGIQTNFIFTHGNSVKDTIASLKAWHTKRKPCAEGSEHEQQYAEKYVRQLQLYGAESPSRRRTASNVRFGMCAGRAMDSQKEHAR